MTAYFRDNGVNSKFKFSSSPPLLPDAGVIALVPDAWGEYWESRHYIMSRLARYFSIVWINPATELYKMRFRREILKSRQVYDYPTPPDFVVYEPGIWLPKVHRSHFVARIPERLRLGRAYNILHRHGCCKTILYLWRPEYASALDLIRHDVSCYHIDDEYTFSKAEIPLQEEESRLISRVDTVFIHSPGLMEKKGHLNPQTVFLPNGVDYRAYASTYDEPVDLQRIPRPRIGYIGKIKKHLDFALLHALAQRHRDWSFVFVGPCMNTGNGASFMQQLSQMSNVHFLGPKPLDQLPAYTQHFDVCTLCYELNDYTKYIYPLKLHEYLASGRPVVGSPFRTLRDFTHLIKLAGTLDEWSKALIDALNPAANTPAQIEARRCIARQHDWDILVHKIAESVCKHLGPAYLKMIEERSTWLESR
jgi:glycosyltransferase involved in cell wall biosynthesis